MINMKKYIIVCSGWDNFITEAKNSNEAFIKFLTWYGYTYEKFKALNIAIKNMNSIKNCIDLFEQVSNDSIEYFAEISNEIINKIE